MEKITLSSGRRRLILSALRWGGAGLVPAGAVFRRAGAAAPASERPRFMRRAFELRQISLERGDHGYGAVVVKDGVVVGEGGNAVNTTPDPTAHSEVQAIRDAARRFGLARLTGCELFTNATLSDVRNGGLLGRDRAHLHRRIDHRRRRSTLPRVLSGERPAKNYCTFTYRSSLISAGSARHPYHSTRRASEACCLV
jgi:hypothetical protein